MFEHEEHQPNEPHDEWGRPLKINMGEILMNLEKAYQEWQDNNHDEDTHMIRKKHLKPRTLQLWSRKIDAWKAKKIREKKNAK